MNILDRYIAKSVAESTLLVMMVMLSLFTFFAFADELGDVGKGNYDGIDALIYSIATIPKLTYQLFPASALIGTMLGLGALASHSELTAMRASGYSYQDVLKAVMKIGAVMMLLAFVVGEFLAPYTERYAETKRAIAQSSRITLQTESGLWVREGDRFINIQKILPGARLGDVQVFELNSNGALREIVRANEAEYQLDGSWRLEEIEQISLKRDFLTLTTQEQSYWKAWFNPDFLEVVMINPETMPAWTLYQYSNYLESNGVDARKYQQAFWIKLISPISTLLMVIAALPFIFGSLRLSSAGHRVLIGTLVGIGFHLFSQVFNYVGLVYHLNPFLAATLPTAVFFLVDLFSDHSLLYDFSLL